MAYPARERGGQGRMLGERSNWWNSRMTVPAGVPPAVGGIPVSQRKEYQGDAHTLDHIDVDPLVYLRMAKHARDNPVGPTRGVLLGLDQVVPSSRRIRGFVTHAIPMPDGLDPDGKDALSYVKQMIHMAGEVNVEPSVIGWYVCASLGECLDSRFIDDALEYQEALGERALVLVFDPTQMEAGRVGLQAYRVTSPGVSKRKEMGSRTNYTNYQAVNVSTVTHDGVLQSIPLRLQSSPLLATFLSEYFTNAPEGADHCTADLRALNLDESSHSEKQLGCLLEGLDRLIMGNTGVKMDLLTATQLQDAVEKLKDAAGEATDKLYAISTAAAM